MFTLIFFLKKVIHFLPKKLCMCKQKSNNFFFYKKNYIYASGQRKKKKQLEDQKKKKKSIFVSPILAFSPPHFWKKTFWVAQEENTQTPTCCFPLSQPNIC